MFEENENIYPVKPELLLGGRSRNRFVLIILLVLLGLYLTDFISDSYFVLFELLLVLVVHEFGHFIMMLFYRSKAQGMFFMSFLSGLTKTFKHSDSQKEQAMINLMGPIPGLIIGCLLFLYCLNGEPDIRLVEMSLLFLGVNLINLIPIDPFDGGRIIESFFFYKDDQTKMIFTLVSSLTIIIVGVIISFIPLIIFGFFMGLKVRSYQKSRDLHESLTESNINYKKEYKDLTDKEYWSIRSAFLNKNPKLREVIPTGFSLWENETLLMEQVRQVLRVNIRPDLGLVAKILILLFMIILVAIPVYIVSSNYELIDWYIKDGNV